MTDLLEHRQDGVATLTRNPPERLSALSGDMMRRLTEALSRLGGDAEKREPVFTGR